MTFKLPLFVLALALSASASQAASLAEVCRQASAPPKLREAACKGRQGQETLTKMRRSFSDAVKSGAESLEKARNLEPRKTVPVWADFTGFFKQADAVIEAFRTPKQKPVFQRARERWQTTFYRLREEFRSATEPLAELDHTFAKNLKDAEDLAEKIEALLEDAKAQPASTTREDVVQALTEQSSRARDWVSKVLQVHAGTATSVAGRASDFLSELDAGQAAIEKRLDNVAYADLDAASRGTAADRSAKIDLAAQRKAASLFFRIAEQAAASFQAALAGSSDKR